MCGGWLGGMGVGDMGGWVVGWVACALAWSMAQPDVLFHLLAWGSKNAHATCITPIVAQQLLNDLSMHRHAQHAVVEGGGGGVCEGSLGCDFNFWFWNAMCFWGDGHVLRRMHLVHLVFVLCMSFCFVARICACLCNVCTY
jgi:hypothetical protein